MIVATKISKIYRLGKIKVLAIDEVSVDISESKIYCITGRSGSGKSTLLRQLGLLDKPDSGNIIINDQNSINLSEKERTHVRLSQFGFVFQNYALIPELTALENVLLPKLQLSGGSYKELKSNAKELLSIVGLGERINHRPSELSGGEQQRVAFARAMANNPKVIFADEPTANLDTVATATIMYTLTKLNRETGVTIVFVSHDPSDYPYAHEVIELSDGKVIKRTVK